MKPTELFLPKVARIAEEQLQLRRSEVPENKLYNLSKKRLNKIDFIQSLHSGPRPRVIAEVKRKSPSLGDLAMDLDPCTVALAYARAGAAAISVLTESTFFGGSHEDLRRIRQVLPNHPLLFKDFVIDPYQILEASAYGADAVLLIYSLLGPERIRDFYSLASSLGLTPLIEVHDQSEFADAVRMGACLLGVNNRNLTTLKTDLNISRQIVTSQALSKDSGITLISESGLNTAEDILRFEALGFDAYLIGTSLMRNRNPESALSELRKSVDSNRLQQVHESDQVHRISVKVCGITRLQDAQLALDLGAHAIGFVIAPSPRQITLTQAKIISRQLPKNIHRVGVFVDPSIEHLSEAVFQAELSGIQLHGCETSAFVKEVRQMFPELHLIKALPLPLISQAEDYPCDAVLIDPPRLDNQELQHGPLPHPLKGKFMYLAGGLTGENVAGFIRSHKPQGVDVSRGVESSPGIKDAIKMKHFFAQIDSSNS